MADKLPPTAQNVKFISRAEREGGGSGDKTFFPFAAFASGERHCEPPFFPAVFNCTAGLEMGDCRSGYN
jgi:hypothetical protein